MSQKKILRNSKWEKEFDYDWSKRAFFTITGQTFIVQMTGGSIIIFDKGTHREICRYKGHTYVYTGDIKPDESELFALENGKHFYIYSLASLEQKCRVTLPRTYEAIDVYGMYSPDGRYLYIPVQKYEAGEYKHWLCEYETETYTLLNMKQISKKEVWKWP